MANEQNLVRGDEAHTLTAEEASKGGKASGESRRRKRQLRDALQEILDREHTDVNGNTADGTTILAAQLFKKAMKGDVRAWEVLRDTVGQKPVERLEVSSISPEARAEMDELLGL